MLRLEIPAVLAKFVMLVLKYTVSILRQLRLRYPEFTINQDLPNDL